MKYEQIIIKSEADYPKVKGTYFFNRSGFESVQELIPYDGTKSYMREIRWYLAPVKTGTYVSRSVFQKLKEENKRLLEDIRVMATGECFDAIQLRIKWRKHFKAEKEMADMIREVILGSKKADYTPPG